MINAIAIDDEPLALEAIRALCEESGIISLQKTFTNPLEAFKHLRKFPTDLIFTDIVMPAMTGIDLIRSLKTETMVIFTTAFSEHAAVSYEVNAVDYLLKPINKERFMQAVDKAKEYYSLSRGQNAERCIFIRADFSLIKIPLDEILYIEGLADYLKIYIRNRKTVVARMPMKDMMERLPTEEFIRVHRSFILPYSKIEAVKGAVIFLADRKIPLGKTYIEDFFNRYLS